MVSNIRNVRATSDGESVDKIRLILVCPRAAWWTNDKDNACRCRNALPWYHCACGGADWIDKEGRIWCSSGCSGHGSRLIFDVNFICDSDREKTSRLNANHVARIITAMGAAAEVATDGAILNDDQTDALDNWTNSLKKSLRAKSAAYQ